MIPVPLVLEYHLVASLLGLLQTSWSLVRGDTTVHQGVTWASCAPGPSDVGSQVTPGRAAQAYAAIKAEKYVDQPNFGPAPPPTDP